MDLRFAGILIAAYFIGNFSPGWLLVKIFGGGDVRAQGSGGTGATNTARALGKKWFYVVLAIDIAKSIFAVLLPAIIYPEILWKDAAGVLITQHSPDGAQFMLTAAAASGTAVVAGHIWPLLMGFRGGKGIGPFLGVWFGLGVVAWPAFWFLPFTLLAPIAGGVFFLPLKKGAFMCALCALWTQPIALWILTRNDSAALLSLLIVILILTAHRSNFKKAFSSLT